MKEAGNKRIWKELETKEYECNWKQKNMKEILTQRI